MLRHSNIVKTHISVAGYPAISGPSLINDYLDPGLGLALLLHHGVRVLLRHPDIIRHIYPAISGPFLKNYHVDPGIDALEGVSVQSCGRISSLSLMNYLVPGVDLDALLHHSVEISLPYMVRNLNHN